MKYTKYLMVLAIAALAVGVFWSTYSMSEEAPMKGNADTMASTNMGYEKATFAGGCFWCMEPPFDKLDGVISTISGYTGGHKKDPTYQEVSAGGTGHTESVEVLYDPKKVSYIELLEVFWRSMDPTSSDRQFVDVGNQYRPAIFYHNEEQHRLALESKKALEDSGIFDEPIVVEIVPAGVYYPAEEYHQDYYTKNPVRYHFYRFNSGRDRFLDKYWKGHDKPFFATPERLGKMKDTMMKDTMPNEGGKVKMYTKPSDEVLKKTLTSIQYKVTQKDGTEPAYNNEYWDNKHEGIYVDVVSGEPLFSSRDKYDSGTGWPSFSKPMVPENIVLREDRSFFSVRTEVRSKHGDSHLGHVFDDGPKPTGKRYCMNSAALRFIAKEDLEKEGYGEFLNMFK